MFQSWCHFSNCKKKKVETRILFGIETIWQLHEPACVNYFSKSGFWVELPLLGHQMLLLFFHKPVLYIPHKYYPLSSLKAEYLMQ